MQGPRILAGFVQGTLAAVSSLDAGLGDAVVARLAPGTHERLTQASRIAWLELDVDVELTHAIYAELGRARAQELFRRNLTGALDAPILRSLAQGALRLFGASPSRIFGWAPKAYGQLYRDAGVMRFEQDAPGSARLELESLPACVAESARYLDGIAASIAGGFDFMGVKGEVCIESHTPSARRATFRLEWDDEAEGGESLPVLAGA
jgi:hypothetical protein